MSKNVLQLMTRNLYFSATDIALYLTSVNAAGFHVSSPGRKMSVPRIRILFIDAKIEMKMEAHVLESAEMLCSPKI
jgi:hypothetical protein